MGLPTAGLSSKSVEQLAIESFDVVVTVCDNAKEECPILPGAAKSLHWPFEDPADATGSDHEKMEVFRTVRDQIRARIEAYLGQPDP